MDNKRMWKWKLPKDFHIGKLKKDQILILFLVGVLLLVIAVPTGKSRKSEEQKQSYGSDNSADAMTENEYVTYLEQHLEQTLSQMEGAGDVTVMITLESSAEKVVEKDVERSSENVTEADSQGGTRTTVNTSHGETTVYDGGETDHQTPYISKEITPRVEGVIVLAAGGDNAVISKNITEAVQALFGIDTHKIRIMKKN